MRLKAIIQEDRISWCLPPFWAIGLPALAAAALLAGGAFFLSMDQETEAGGPAGWIVPLALLAFGCFALAGTVQLARKTARGEPIAMARMDGAGVAVRTSMLGGEELFFGWESVSKLVFVDKLSCRVRDLPGAGTSYLGRALLVGLEDDAGPRPSRRAPPELFLELDDGSVFIAIQPRRESMEAARGALSRLAEGRAEVESRERLRLALRPPRPPRGIPGIPWKRE